MNTLVFVYGTLKRGCTNHCFLHDQKFVGHARTVPGYTLYDLGGFPGITPEAADANGVSGEVWSVGPDALLRLDAFEGVNEGLYRREPIPLQAPFANRKVEAYVPTATLTGRRLVGAEWLE